MSQFFVSAPEEFVSDPSAAQVSSGNALGQGPNADVSHHVAVLANSMLSELQRLANVFSIDPNEMSSLARLITSALEELDVLVTENAAVAAAASQAKADLEQVLAKLNTEQDLRQTSDRRQWALQDVVDQERRQHKSQLEQMKLSNAQLKERLKTKTNSVQALQDDLEEVRKRQAEERQSHLEAIKRYMLDKEPAADGVASRAMSNAAVFAPTGTFRRRSSIRSSRSKRSNTMSPSSVNSVELRSPPPPDLAEETHVPASEEAKEGAAELQRLRRSETMSHSSDDWEAAMGMAAQEGGGLSLQSELSMSTSDDSRPPSAGAPVAYVDLEGQSLLSDGDVDAVIDDVNQLAKDAAEVDEQRAQLAKENQELREQMDDSATVKGELQQLVASLQTNKDHLEAESRGLREEITRLKEEASRASRTAAVPDFSVQLRKENERLMKLYSFYKEKCQNLQDDLARQSEPLEAHSGLRGLFARLLSGLRRRAQPDKQRLITPPPTYSGSTSGASSPDLMPTDSTSVRQTKGSVSSDDSCPDSRTPLMQQQPLAAPPTASTIRRSPQPTPRRSPNTKRASLMTSAAHKAKSMTISYRARRTSSSEVSISFDPESRPVVTSTGMFTPTGDWVVGNNMLRDMDDSQTVLPSCTQQVALFSAEASRISCVTVSTCHGAPTTLDAPLIDLSSPGDRHLNSASGAAVPNGPLCQQMWVCTKQINHPCQVEILDIIGSGSLRHTGTIMGLDPCTRSDTILSMEFIPDLSVSTSGGLLSSSQLPLAASGSSSSGSSSSVGSGIDPAATLPTAWMGTDSDDGHVIIYNARPGVDLGKKLQECHFQHGAVTCIRYAFQRTFIGFSNGLVLGFDRQAGSPCSWDMTAKDRDTLKLSDLSTTTSNRQLNDVTCMEAVETLLWCSCGTYIFSVDPATLTVVSCAKTSSRHPISHMISVGCGVVLAMAHSSKLQFCHMTSLQVVQEFETSALQEVVDQSETQVSGKLCAVTSLALCDNCLWVGTGTGVLLQLPLKTELDTSSLQMALADPACSCDTACVAQWSHWSAVRCLQVVQCANHASFEDSSDSFTKGGDGRRCVVLSGGLGSLDFRDASATELRHRSRFTSFSTSHRGKRASVATDSLRPNAGPQKFQQLLVWRAKA